MFLSLPWYDYLARFIAGAFLANGVPHFVQGVCGNKFQTPFATPLGVGLSAATANVIWGWLNFIAGGGLLRFFFPPLLPPPFVSITTMLGVLSMALLLSHHFGKLRNSVPYP
jgi:hypothetical protein